MTGPGSQILNLGLNIILRGDIRDVKTLKLFFGINDN